MTCMICGKPTTLQTNGKYRKTCSKYCLKKQKARDAKKTTWGSRKEDK